MDIIPWDTGLLCYMCKDVSKQNNGHLLLQDTQRIEQDINVSTVLQSFRNEHKPTNVFTKKTFLIRIILHLKSMMLYTYYCMLEIGDAKNGAYCTLISISMLIMFVR